MRLIDADAVLVWFAEYWSMQKKLRRPSNQQRGIYMAMRSMVNSRPTVDAVPVIRCRDCRWWRADKESCMEWYDSPYAEANGYCSRAERKDDIVVIHPEDIVFNSEEDEKAYYEALGAERKEE